MSGRAGRRWPRIAQELARADAGTAALLDTVEQMLPAAGPQTLPQVLAPVRAYLLWALGADRGFEGACVFAGEIAAAGHPPVQVRVELLAPAPEEGRRVHGPCRRPAPADAGEARISPAGAAPGPG